MKCKGWLYRWVIPNPTDAIALEQTARYPVKIVQDGDDFILYIGETVRADRLLRHERIADSTGTAPRRTFEVLWPGQLKSWFEAGRIVVQEIEELVIDLDDDLPPKEQRRLLKNALRARETQLLLQFPISPPLNVQAPNSQLEGIGIIMTELQALRRR